MMVTVLFPKAQAYNNKGLEEKRFIDSVFNKHMKKLMDAGCLIEYLLEDELARAYFDKVTYAKTRMITCVSDADIIYFANYQDAIDLSPIVYEEFKSTPNYSFNMSAKYDVPFELLMQDKQKYQKEKVSSYYKRVRRSVELLIANRKSILMFDAGAINNRCQPLSNITTIGDGKLLMQVDLSNDVEVNYYGGVFIEADMVPQILSIGD